MSFTAILRRSVAALAPAGARLIRSQKPNQSALFTALYHQSSSPLLKPAFRSVSPTHYYSSKAAMKRTSSDDTLLSVLEAEIESAVEAEDQDKADDVPENFPFEIEDNPGEQTISLSRTYQGENINVVVHMPDMVSGEQDEDNDDDNDNENESSGDSSIPMVVRISKKKGPCLEFGCTAFADEIAIDTLAVKDPEATEDQIAYEGPDFTDLDENLQKAFHKYLEIRGIKPITTNFLHEYMISKDSREYLMWLKNLKSFIEA